jgi:MFS transporter, YQGE family, putative transporter
MSMPLRRLSVQAVRPAEQGAVGRDARMLLVMHTLLQFGTSIAAIFLNLYLWRISQSLWINGMFQAINMAFVAVGFAVAGWLAKRWSPMIPYRLGILLLAVFYLAILILKESVVNSYVILAIFCGLAGGFYWMGYQVLAYDVTNESNRIRYLGINTVWNTLAALVGPVFAGWIIGRSGGTTGYLITFGVVFVAFALSSAVTYWMREAGREESRYQLGLSFRLTLQDSDWLRTFMGFFIMGSMQGVMIFLPNLLLFQATGSEEKIGYLGVLMSLTSMLSGYVQSKHGRRDQYGRYVWLAAFGFLAGSLLIAGSFSLWAVLGFLLLYGFFGPLQSNILASVHYSMISRLPAGVNLRVETMVVREIFLDLGRIVSIVASISLTADMSGPVMAIVLVTLALMQFTLPLCVSNTAKRLKVDAAD